MPQTPLRPPSDVTQILNDLEDNGYSAIHLLPEPDVAVLRTLFYRWLADLGTGITSDPATWTDSRMPKQAKGIYHSYGCGHAACSWALRCHPDVRGLFAAVHKCSPDQLLTGFDGLGFMRPPELLAEMGVKQEPGTSWPHLDFMPVQNGVVRERFPVVQGNVALYNSGPEDGGLVVYSGSHKLFNTSWEGREVKQFSALFQDGKELPKGVERIKLCGPPGTFFIWKSTLMHCNQPAHPTRNLPNPYPRMALYVCMMPITTISPSQLEFKAYCFKNKITTGHRPHVIDAFPPGSPWKDDPVNLEKVKLTPWKGGKTADGREWPAGRVMERLGGLHWRAEECGEEDGVKAEMAIKMAKSQGLDARI